MDHPVDRDALGLVKKFAAKKSLKFEDFKSEWLGCRFYLMHCLGKDTYSRISIIERILIVVIDRALDESVEFHERLGSVYLCYSLYCTQLNSDSVKIRINVTQFNVLQLFIDELRSNGVHDADYVLCKLKSFSAFLVCACQRKKCMGMSQQNDMATTTELSLADNEQCSSSRSDLLLTYDRSHNMLQEYQQLKRSISLHLPSHLTEVSNILDKEQIQLDLTSVPEETGQQDEHATATANEVSRRTQLSRKQYIPKRTQTNKEQ